MSEDALAEQQLLLAKVLIKVDILEELPQDEVEYVATRSAVVRLGKKESFDLGVDSRSRTHAVSSYW
jgi:hypothetical protein